MVNAQDFGYILGERTSISANTKLLNCITALMLLSTIEDSETVSVMKGAEPSDESLSCETSNDAVLSSITYQSVSSDKCDKTSYPSVDHVTLSASSAGTSRSSEQTRNEKGRSKGKHPSMKYHCYIWEKYMGIGNVSIIMMDHYHPM